MWERILQTFHELPKEVQTTRKVREVLNRDGAHLPIGRVKQVLEAAVIGEMNEDAVMVTGHTLRVLMNICGNNHKPSEEAKQFATELLRCLRPFFPYDVELEGALYSLLAEYEHYQSVAIDYIVEGGHDR